MEPNTQNPQPQVRPAVQPATQAVQRPAVQPGAAAQQTAARPVVNNQPAATATVAQTTVQKPATQPTAQSAAQPAQRPVVQPATQPVQRPVVQPAATAGAQKEPEIQPTQTKTGAPVEEIEEKPAIAIDETKTFTELNEYDSFKDEEKSFFASAFSTYLPAALSVIGLIVYMLSTFMVLVNALTIANWIIFVAKAVTVSGLVVETIRQIKANKFEFGPSLIIVLLTVFVVM